MGLRKVDIFGFEEKINEYIFAGKPLAISRHGQTIGFFIPTHGQSNANLAALKNAWEQLDQMLASKGINPNDVIADFEAARAAARKPG